MYSHSYTIPMYALAFQMDLDGGVLLSMGAAFPTLTNLDAPGGLICTLHPGL